MGLWFQLMIHKSDQVRWLGTPEHPNRWFVDVFVSHPCSRPSPSSWHPPRSGCPCPSVSFPYPVSYDTCPVPVLVSRPSPSPCHLYPFCLFHCPFKFRSSSVELTQPGFYSLSTILFIFFYLCQGPTLLLSCSSSHLIRVQHGFRVQRGSYGSALACCKAGPKTNLDSAPHGGSAHWACSYDEDMEKGLIECYEWMIVWMFMDRSATLCTLQIAVDF